ncbi:hypothetical protein Tco_0172704 [Tanacetum coccineum]
MHASKFQGMGCPMMGGESDVGGGGGTLGGGDNGEFRYPLVEGDDKRVWIEGWEKSITPEVFVLVQWSNKDKTEATWQRYDDLLARFP